MTTTATPSTEPAEPTGPVAELPAPRPHADSSGAGFATTALAVARRTILQFFRTPQVLMMGSIQGALFLFMFRYVFGGAISKGLGGLDYVDFLVPGFLVTVILWTGMSAAAGVAEDGATGVYDRLRSLPVPRAGVMVGRSLADATLGVWGIFVTGIVGLLVGFRTHAPIGRVLIGVVLMAIAGYAFTWVFITMGLVSANAQAAQGLSMLVIPFSFVSSANVPVETMPGWMQPFARNQPVSCVINAVRCLFQGREHVVGIGHSTTYWLILSLVWCVVISLVFGTIAVRRFGRTR